MSNKVSYLDTQTAIKSPKNSNYPSICSNWSIHYFTTIIISSSRRNPTQSVSRVVEWLTALMGTFATHHEHLLNFRHSLKRILKLRPFVGAYVTSLQQRSINQSINLPIGHSLHYNFEAERILSFSFCMRSNLLDQAEKYLNPFGHRPARSTNAIYSPREFCCNGLSSKCIESVHSSFQPASPVFFNEASPPLLR